MTQQEESYFEKFLLSLKEVNIHIAIQSVLDALDIWLSCIKYYFEIVFPSYLNLNPGDTMKTWLGTPEGLITFLAGAIFLATFSFLGNYYDAENPRTPEIVYQKADKIWPYFRDAFKGFKWTFKASRNVLEVLGILIGVGLLGYGNIIGISFGVAASLNRLWYRGQVEERKKFQTKNEDLNRHIYATSLAYYSVKRKWLEQLKKLPDDQKALFKGTIFKVENNFYTITSESNNQIIELTLNPGENQKVISQQEMDFLKKISHRKLDYLHFSKQIQQPEFQTLKNILSEKNNLSQLNFNELDFFNEQQNSAWMFTSAFIGGSFNAPYYFLGLITTLKIPGELYIYFVGVCAFFMILNVIAEMYLEYDYQRRLNISANKTKLSITNQLIAFELDKLNELFESNYNNNGQNLNYQDKKEHILKIIQSVSSEVKLKHLFQAPTIVANPVIPLEASFKTNIIQTINRIDSLVENYLSIRQQFKDDVELSKNILLWQGIRNGLQLYGVLNGIILAINVVADLYKWKMPLYFFYGNFIFAAVFVIGMMIYTYKNGQSKKDVSLENQLSDSDQLFKNTSDKMPYLMPNHLCQQLDTSKNITPSTNLMVSEQSEVFRQFTSGFRKGIKFLSTTKSLNLFSNPDNPVYYLVGLIYGIYFSFKGLRGLMRLENKDYKKAFILSPFFTPPPEEKSQSIHQLISNNSIITPN